MDNNGLVAVMVTFFLLGLAVLALGCVHAQALNREKKSRAAQEGAQAAHKEVSAALMGVVADIGALVELLQKHPEVWAQAQPLLTSLIRALQMVIVSHSIGQALQGPKIKEEEK